MLVDVKETVLDVLDDESEKELGLLNLEHVLCDELEKKVYDVDESQQWEGGLVVNDVVLDSLNYELDLLIHVHDALMNDHAEHVLDEQEIYHVVECAHHAEVSLEEHGGMQIQGLQMV